VDEEPGTNNAFGILSPRTSIKCATVEPEPKPTTIPFFTNLIAASAALLFHFSISKLFPN